MRFWIRALIVLAAFWGIVSLYRWRAASEHANAWAEFLALDGKESGARAAELFARFAPADRDVPGFDGEPWAVARLRPGEEGERIVALRSFRAPAERGGAPLPAAHATILNAAGEVLGETPFVCGTEKRPRVDALRGHPLIGDGVRLTLLDGGEEMRMTYAPEARSLRLVRVEGADGEIRTRPEWSFGAGGVGPAPSREQPADWARMLDARRPVLALETLTWLGTRFEPPAEGPAPYAFLERTRANGAVRAAISELTRSGDDWMRSAAFLAERP